MPAASLSTSRLRSISMSSTRARSAQAEAMFEDMLAIADDGSQDRVMVDGKLRVDNEVAARSRLRVDTRRWALSKLSPVKYGDKVTSVLEGGERPVEFAGMSEDQLRAWIVKEAQALGLGAAIADKAEALEVAEAILKKMN